MNRTRRQFIEKMAAASGVLGLIIGTSRPARACLYGKWWVVCPNNHADLVDDGTCQHKCEECGLQAFRGSQVTVRCPNGHNNPIDTAPCGQACTNFNCPTCGADCRVG